jgi:hypothetical protein
VLRPALVALALSAAALPQLSAQQSKDSTKQEQDDGVRRDRIRFRTRPSFWRYQAGYPRFDFHVQAPMTRFHFAPELRNRFRTEWRGQFPRGWAWRLRPRYRTI